MFHMCSCNTRTLTQQLGTHPICQVIDISPITIIWDCRPIEDTIATLKPDQCFPPDPIAQTAANNMLLARM